MGLFNLFEKKKDQVTKKMTTSEGKRCKNWNAIWKEKET